MMAGQQVTLGAVATDKASEQSVTERMFDQLARNKTSDPQATGAGGATTLEDLKRMDKIWHSMRHNPPKKPPQVVSTSSAPLGAAPQYDVIVCGGTLGIFLATALQRGGLRVAVLERGKLQGRAQEWNVSRAEMARLVELGVLSEQELETVIGLEFNPVRVGFKVRGVCRAAARHAREAAVSRWAQAPWQAATLRRPARPPPGSTSFVCAQSHALALRRRAMQDPCARVRAGASDVANCIQSAWSSGNMALQGGEDIWTKDVLNLGVKPDKMVETAARRFRDAGGTVLDRTAASGFTVHPDGVAIAVGDNGEKPLTGRLLIDCMGHSSPIVRQIRCACRSVRPRVYARTMQVKHSCQRLNLWMELAPARLHSLARLLAGPRTRPHCLTSAHHATPPRPAGKARSPTACAASSAASAAASPRTRIASRTSSSRIATCSSPRTAPPRRNTSGRRFRRARGRRTAPPTCSRISTLVRTGTSVLRQSHALLYRYAGAVFVHDWVYQGATCAELA